MIQVLLNSLVPIFAVAGLGYVAGRKRELDNGHLAELNALVVEFAIPASLFVTTAGTRRAVLAAQWPLLVVLGVTMLALYGLSYGLQRAAFHLAPGEASVQSLTVALPNFAAAGFPLFSAVFGPDDTVGVALAIAAGSVLLAPLTLAVLELQKGLPAAAGKRGGVTVAIARSLRKPVVLAPLLGVAFSLLGIPLPQAAVRSLQLIGQAAGGVALFLTGLILSAQRISLNSNVWSAALLRNVVHPLLALGVLLILPMDRETARAVILLCAFPSGIFGVLFALSYGLESRVAGSTLIVSSLASVVTLPVALILTSSW